MADAHRNFARGTLTNSPGTAGTSFILGSGEGARFAANMPVTIVPANTQPDSSNAEIGYVTSVASNTLTVTRAQESTTAVNATAGYEVFGSITAKSLTDIETDVASRATTTYVDSGDTAAKDRANHTGTQTASTISDFSTAADARITAATGVSVQAYDADLTTWGSKTAPSGTVVGTTDTQTLTNKTVDDSTFTIQDEADNTKKAQFQVSGVTTGTTRTLTVPNTSGTLYVTGGTDVSVADGGTGRSTSTTAYGIIAAGTTATGAQQTISPGTSGHFLKSAGASALASFSAIAQSDVTNLTTDLAAKASLTGTETLTNKTLTNPLYTGNSGVPSTPAAGVAVLYGIGTSNLNLGWMNQSGTQINITGGLGSWTAWTPTVTAASGTFTSVSGAGRYTQIGKTVIWKVDITVTTVGTASGAVLFTIPVTAAYSLGMIGAGREDALSGKALTCKLTSTTQASSLNYDNTSAIAAGAVLRLSGQYEAA